MWPLTSISGMLASSGRGLQPFWVNSWNYDSYSQFWGFQLSSERHFKLVRVQQRAAWMIEQLDTPLNYACGRACVPGCRHFYLGASRCSAHLAIKRRFSSCGDTLYMRMCLKAGKYGICIVFKFQQIILGWDIGKVLSSEHTCIHVCVCMRVHACVYVCCVLSCFSAHSLYGVWDIKCMDEEGIYGAWKPWQMIIST